MKSREEMTGLSSFFFFPFLMTTTVSVGKYDSLWLFSRNPAISNTLLKKTLKAYQFFDDDGVLITGKNEREAGRGPDGQKIYLPFLASVKIWNCHDASSQG